MLLLELPGDPAILRLRGRVTRQQTLPVAGFAVRFDSQADADASRRALHEFVERVLAEERAPRP
jgi:hypothetical protein